MTTEPGRAQRAYAMAVRLYGRDDPRTGRAWRELAAAKLTAAVHVATDAGLDALDVAAVVQTGQLPAEVAA